MEDQIWVSATRLVLSPQDTTRIGIITASNGRFLFSAAIRRDPALEVGPSGTWSSSDSSVVTVQPGGLVTAGAPGEAVLTVRSGQLTDSAIVFVRHPQDTSTDFIEVQAGLAHACGRTRAGELYCWGISWFGETGLGAVRRFTATVSPARVPGLQTVTHFSLGLRHSCALDAAGRAWCWGEKLPGGTANPTPAPVPTETRFVAISAGSIFSCGISVGAQLYCWGLGFSGIQAVSTPTPLISISVGQAHACGLAASGSAYCFGANAIGELGTGDRLSRTGMAAVHGSLTFLSVSSGIDYACGVSVERNAFCWGSGAKGRLGTGLTDSFDKPVAVPGLEGVATIDAGSGHTCAVKETGAAWCWGEEFRGQLGNGPSLIPQPNAADLIQLSPVPVSLPLPASTISAGWGESTCAVSTTSQAFCWGLNTNGQLGNGRHDFAAGSSLRFHEWPTIVRIVP